MREDSITQGCFAARRQAVEELPSLGEAIGRGESGDEGRHRRCEERERLLINELNHRVSNMLATVQSIAALTLGDGDAAGYEGFEARLSALGRVHELLARRAWDGVPLHELLMQVLVPYRAAAQGRLYLTGPKIVFDAHTVLALSMAFHEIARRAADEGAFSCPGGRIEVCWRIVTADGHATRLRLIWREYGSALSNLFSHQGFGPRLVERSITGQLRGTLAFECTTDGARYVIELPLRDDVAAAR